MAKFLKLKQPNYLLFEFWMAVKDRIIYWPKERKVEWITVAKLEKLWIPNDLKAEWQISRKLKTERLNWTNLGKVEF